MPVEVEPGTAAVAVRFLGRDRFWAFSRGITIPWHRVAGAAAVDRSVAERTVSRLRMGGSFLPRRLRAGRYGVGARRQLWCVHRAPRVLVIDLVDGPPCRVVVEVADPDGLAREIEARRRG